ncbi:Peptidase_M10 domain-containing protein/PG_binding_1 domain-containing protein [Cephalotus follicularis]|uniref:Peptidase_M10 domain-containing protein/PG_binding_1 domain-containing protein n=1 Tax=Cephalotus follicularis TaxID=3775 RepID=A0A1Q3CEH8_CEPFO|nr:Peptidase_M10 domain-containing protein/PG_binding_1 domain-containing protein [Cephalotus follicularis]
MASKVISLLLFICLLTLSYKAVLAQSDEKNPSPFGFLQSLIGHKRGDRVKGIQYLKKNLQQFGYLNHTQISSNGEEADLFDENIESAIKTYQINFNLQSSGILDTETVSTMSQPRCGVADIVNGNTRMRAGHEMHHHGNSNNSHALYAFFPGKPRWPFWPRTLRYQFKNGTRGDAIKPVQNGFARWGGFIPFQFEPQPPYQRAPADFHISFETGDHGDGHPFDGPGGKLAHSFPPRDGRLHFDASEKWSVGAVADSIDIGTVALHEIGHLLGLEHSSVKEAIMYPVITRGRTKDLANDDIQGIKALYAK